MQLRLNATSRCSWRMHLHSHIEVWLIKAHEADSTLSDNVGSILKVSKTAVLSCQQKLQAIIWYMDIFVLAYITK